MSIPISTGSGAASVAADAIGGLQYQQIEIYPTNASVITVWQNSSVIAIESGSVISVPSGSVITVWKDSSVLAVPVGSVITVLQSPSVVGTYADNAAWTQGNKGLEVMGLRNDTLASVSAADLRYTPHAVGQAGETITANAPLIQWIQGTADFRGNAGASIVAIAASGSSIFQYITGVQVGNLGSASVLVTLAAGGSTLGYTIAPAGGGSNIIYLNGLKTPANFGFAASISGQASVLLSAQGFISKT